MTEICRGTFAMRRNRFTQRHGGYPKLYTFEVAAGTFEVAQLWRRR